MSRSYDLSYAQKVTVGTIGPPGQRLFLLQARRGEVLLTLKIEKRQVAALSQYVTRMLEPLPEQPVDAGDVALEQPAEPEWAVGSITLSYDADLDQVVMVAEEAVPPLGADPDDEPAPPDVDPGAGGPALARISTSSSKARAFASYAAKLVAAGRPPCPLCGHPLDPSGHSCPRSNGHRPPQP